MRAFIIRIGRDQFVEIVFLFGYVAVGSRLVGKNEKLFALRSFVRKADCLVEMFEEFLGGRRGVCAFRFRGCEIGIECDGLVKMRERILNPKFVGQLPSLQKFASGFFGLGCDGDLSTRCGICGSVGLVTNTPACCRQYDQHNRNETRRFTEAHRGTPSSFEPRFLSFDFKTARWLAHLNPTLRLRTANLPTVLIAMALWSRREGW